MAAPKLKKYIVFAEAHGTFAATIEADSEATAIAIMNNNSDVDWQLCDTPEVGDFVGIELDESEDKHG